MIYTYIGMVLIVLGSISTYYGTYQKNQEVINLETKRKAAIEPYIKRKKFLIIKACADIRQSIYFASFYPKIHGTYLEEAFPEDDELEKMLKMIGYMDEVRVRTFPEAGFYWPEFIYEKMKITMSAIEDIHQKSHLVSNELIEFIIAIENLKLFTNAAHMLRAHKIIKQNEYLDLRQGKKTTYKGNLGYHKEFSEYFRLIKEFENIHFSFSKNPRARKYLYEFN